MSTDLLSRGLSLESINFVVNYDLPLSTKEYVHRVGRTARANHSGKAITFCFGDGDYKWFKRLVYSGGVINRNEKSIGEISFLRASEDPEKLEFILQITDLDKKNYSSCLEDLESEVYSK